MARARETPIWVREAPLTAERGAQIFRKTKLTWGAMTVFFWAACAGAAITSHQTLVTIAVAIIGVLLGIQAATVLLVVRRGIRENTPPNQERTDLRL